MLRIGLLMIMVAAFGSGHAQDPAHFMAPVWAGEEIHGWTVGFEVRSEPVGKTMVVAAPLTAGGNLFLPVFEGGAAATSMPGWLIPVQPGLGGYLEKKTTAAPAWSWATIPANNGRMIVAMQSGKKSKTRSRIGEWDAAGNFSAFPWSDGNSNDLRPVISSGGRLYFQSDRAGGMGGMDIWYSDLQDGVWTDPVNVKAVNSPGHELNPRLDQNGDLLFGSEGRADSKGGFDLFRWNGSSLSPLPYPFNSKFDDIDIQASANGGYWVSSNRPLEAFREQGPYQLFRFTPKKPLTLNAIHGRTGQPLPGQEISAFTNEQKFVGKSDGKGQLNLYLAAGEWVDVMASRELFDTLRVKRLTTGSLGTLNLTERNYWQVNLQIKENGLAATKPATVKIYRQEQLIDSAKTDSKGMLSKDLLPNSAYRFLVRMPGYSDNSLTITTGANGKNLYSRTMEFGIDDAEFVRWQVRKPDGKPLPGIRMTLLQGREELGSVFSLPTDERGFGGAPLLENNTYTLLAMTDGLVGFKEWKTRGHVSKIDTSEVVLEMTALTPGTIIGRFPCPVDPFELQAGNVDGMHIILRILESNPDLKLEVGVHTEARGNAADNLRKSKQAAEFAMDFFVGKGIPKNRLSFKGYGETQIQNRCKEGVNCPDEEHLVNNRLEFRVN